MMMKKQLERPYNCTIKVHSLMCLELKTFIDRISKIYSAFESAWPRCALGLQALCSLQATTDKARLLIQHCSDSSKLYLAITAGKILLRCKKIQNTLDSCLRQIQNMVPSLLAAKIFGIIEDLRTAKFHLETSEEEAGKVVIALIRRDITSSGSVNNIELEALQLAASRLKITSPLAVLLEKRSIKKLLDKVHDANSIKRKILKYLLYLLRKYGESIGQIQTTERDLSENKEPKCHSGDSEQHIDDAWDETQADNSATLEPPEEFKCPISTRLMYDPVIIASGKTYERVWIEKWFNEGHETCPMTNLRLENLYLTPNVGMKSLITRWCSKLRITISDPNAEPIPNPLAPQKLLSSKSTASFDSAMNDLHLQVSSVSLRSSDGNCGSELFDDDNNPGSNVGHPQMTADICVCPSSISGCIVSLAALTTIALLPWKSQCKVVQDIKEQLNKNEHTCEWMFPNNYVKPLIKFLNDAHDLCDVKAQHDSAAVLLTILSKNTNEMPSFDEDAIYVLASFLDSDITEKALKILELLSCHRVYKSEIVASGIIPSILQVLDMQPREFHELVVKILCNLSSSIDMAYHMVYLGCIPKLVAFLGDHKLTKYCLHIMDNVCQIEEGRKAVAETNSGIILITKLLDNGSKQEQEIALEVLLTLCYEQDEFCQVLLDESITQTLFRISVNGNSRAKVIATELLQLLGHITEGVSGSSSPKAGLNGNMSNSPTASAGWEPRGKKSSNALDYLGRKFFFFLR